MEVLQPLNFNNYPNILNRLIHFTAFVIKKQTCDLESSGLTALSFLPVNMQRVVECKRSHRIIFLIAGFKPITSRLKVPGPRLLLNYLVKN